MSHGETVQRKPSIAWTDDERELLVVRARQIRRADHDISFAALFRAAQNVLPNSRRRSYSHPYGDSWLLEASHSADSLRADLIRCRAALRSALALIERELGP